MTASESTPAPDPATLPPTREALGLYRLKAERIQLALTQLPGWSLSEAGLPIVRAYQLPTAQAALTLLCLIAEVARAQGHDAKQSVEGKRLTVTLTSPEAGGVTEADLELARQLALMG